MAAALPAWVSGVQAFSFCFSGNGNDRQYSPYYSSYPRNYPSWSQSDYWPGDYPVITYSWPASSAEIMSTSGQEEEAPALPVDIPGQHIFR